MVQDAFEERAEAAAAEARVAADKAASTRAELSTLASDFSKYKARAHTALKKATSSGADDKRKDEVRRVRRCVRGSCEGGRFILYTSMYRFSFFFFWGGGDFILCIRITDSFTRYALSVLVATLLLW